MSRFKAKIPVDPRGYRWVNKGAFGPEDDRYAGNLFLEWESKEQLGEAYAEEGEVSFTNYYDPFVKEPALFRIFAALEPNETEILEFAKTYGDFCSLEGMLEGVDYTLETWTEVITTVKEFVEAADDFISRQQRARSGKKLTDSTLKLLNELLISADVHLSAELREGGIELKINVFELPYVFYLQIAEAIADLKQYRNCEFCNKPFEVSPQVNRSDRLFCSDNCRVKAYQRRKKKVIDLRKSGKSLSEIAKTTNTQFATVKDWTKDIEKGTK
jgi:hypothetical protein